MNWLTAIGRLLGFLQCQYEPEDKTVVITVRLNAYFLQGSLVSALCLTLIYKYDGITLGAAVQLASDLCQSGFGLLLLGLAVIAFAAAIKATTKPTAESYWTWLARSLPKGAWITIGLCVALIVLLIVVYRAAPFDPVAEAPEASIQVQGAETPRLWRAAASKTGRLP